MQSDSVHPSVGTNPRQRALLPRFGPSEAPAAPRRPRIGRACNHCRTKKAKCSGEHPQCMECKEHGLTCVYELARRDRLQELTDQKHFLVQLLRGLTSTVHGEDRRKIQSALELVEEDKALKPGTARPIDPVVPPSEHVQGLSIHGRGLAGSPSDYNTSPNSHAPTAPWFHVFKRDILSAGLDTGPPPTEDIDTTGFKRIAITPRKANEPGASPQLSSHSSDAVFYLDNHHVQVDREADPEALPPRETAHRLLQTYLHKVHEWLPILANGFEDGLDVHYEKPPRSTSVSWRVLVNLVFAIAARYSDTIAAESQSVTRDHVVYFSRAVHLLNSTKHSINIITSDQNLPMAQAFALISFYYLISGHVSRAWVEVGISIRCALSLDLHLRNEDPLVSSLKKEEHSRTWWSLRCLDTLLSVITHRPCVISYGDCNAPLPRDGDSAREDDESTRTPAPFLRAYSRLCYLTQRCLSNLYAVKSAIGSWGEMQNAIATMDSELVSWRHTMLPRESDLFPDSYSERERLVLEFSCYSTKILITRPGLKPPVSWLQDETSLAYNKKIAEECVDAALAMTRILPDQPQLVFYQAGPWWCIVHFLIQASAVLLLELSSGGAHVPDASLIIDAVKKIVGWLQFLQLHDEVAARAQRIVINILKKSQHHYDIAELLQEERADVYGGYLMEPGTWQKDYMDSIPLYPQLLRPFEEQQSMQSLLSPDPYTAHDAFAMDHMAPPPKYGNAFAPNLLARSEGDAPDERD